MTTQVEYQELVELATVRAVIRAEPHPSGVAIVVMRVVGHVAVIAGDQAGAVDQKEGIRGSEAGRRGDDIRRGDGHSLSR